MDTAHQIVVERRRQLDAEGYTWGHDDQHRSGELLLAALAYMCYPGDDIWPWDADSYKPGPDPIRNLVKAGALISAEGDRLLRRREAGLPVVGGVIVVAPDVDEILATIDGLRQIRALVSEL